MARRNVRSAQLKLLNANRKVQGVLRSFAHVRSQVVAATAIAARPSAIPPLLKLLKLAKSRSALLWVGCGCGEELFAIMRQVRNIYFVAMEITFDDLDTFRRALNKAAGIVAVGGEEDVFWDRRTGCRVRLVLQDPVELTDRQIAALAPRPITHLFSFAIGPSGCWRLHTRLLEFAWGNGVRAVLPVKMWRSAGMLPQTLSAISAVQKATWSSSGAGRHFPFVAIDLPAPMGLGVGDEVRARFQDGGSVCAPENHRIYGGVVLKIRAGGLGEGNLDVRCHDGSVSRRIPPWWVCLDETHGERARWNRLRPRTM